MPSCGFYRCSGPQSENKRKRKNRKKNPPKNKQTVEYTGDGDAKCSWCAWNGPQKNWKRDWNSWKSAEELRPIKELHCWDRPEYWEDSCRPDEIQIPVKTCAHCFMNKQCIKGQYKNGKCKSLPFFGGFHDEEK